MSADSLLVGSLLLNLITVVSMLVGRGRNLEIQTRILKSLVGASLVLIAADASFLALPHYRSVAMRALALSAANPIIIWLMVYLAWTGEETR